MTGRLPYHVYQSGDYVSGEMNMIPAKLAQVGYSTHQFGKVRATCTLHPPVSSCSACSPATS